MKLGGRHAQDAEYVCTYSAFAKCLNAEFVHTYSALKVDLA